MQDDLPPSENDTELGATVRRLAIGDEFLWSPERLVSYEHWVGHIPFAFWLVKVLRPRLVVELGTHRGNSYCAFCQAVSKLQLNARTVAVDTWQGDLHMGREEGVLADLRRHHDPRYDSFSTLLEMTFDAARAHVEPHSVDLLHLDGTHTYEDVRHDFNTWRDSLSSRAVVLFHDINVHFPKFGVWRLWAELSRQFPTFAFGHSCGLGVLGVGSDFPAPLRELFRLYEDPDAEMRTRALFEVRGQGLVARLRAEQEEAKKVQLADALRAANALASTVAAQRDASVAAALSERDAAGAAQREATAAQRKVAAAALNMERKAEAATALARRQDATIHNLCLEIDRLAHDAAHSNASAEAIRSELTTMQSSTMWQATWPIRRVLSATPPGFRRSGRRAAKLLWWTATLQLLSKMRQLQQVRAQAATISARVELPGRIREVDMEPTVTLPDMSAIRAYVPRGRIAVVAHVHYHELWFEMREALSAISDRFDLFVSVTEGTAEAVVPQIRADFPAANVVVFENHGRDILPFLTFAATGVLNRYDLVCKVHTKRTLHRQDGDSWRRGLLDGILRSKDQVQRIIASFDADPDLGIVVANGQVFGNRSEHWVDNRTRVLELGARIGLEGLPEAVTFPGGSIFWMRPFLLCTLLALNLGPADFEPEPLPRDGSTAHAVERLIGLVCAEAGMRIEEIGAAMLPVPAPVVSKSVRLVAYYLPQYHPIPENDEWWGRGFTEWTNVTRARPLFRSHRQPRLPADLGFYDLRMPEVRSAQAELARRYGVGGFCYYYYWFNGRGILRRPLEEMVGSGQPDFPFMLCWANEPWSRNWDGGNREVLLPQTYEPGWPRAFARDIASLLIDPRYIRINGHPMLLIYRVMHIPDCAEAFSELRKELRHLGVGEIHISGGWVGFLGDEELPERPKERGLDSWFEFPPHRILADEVTGMVEGLETGFAGHVYSYRSAVEKAVAVLETTDGATELVDVIHRHRAVMVGWDNTARLMRRAHVFNGATPALLRRWLRAVVRAEAAAAGDNERIVFVNAWNEWAEGAYLEPDRDFGYGWLEAVKSAVADPIATTAAATAAAASAPVPDEGHPAAAGLSDAEWLDTIIAQAEGHPPQGGPLPAFPAPALQAQFVGSANAHAMREAFGFYTLLKGVMRERGMQLGARTQVLDFGCGWGRYIRLLMKDVGPSGLHGGDVDPDMIGFCRVSGLLAQFVILPPHGPSPYEDSSFELVFAYSVFSHLSESAFTNWMREFERILRPGGLLVFTTQPRRFIEWTVELRQRDLEELSGWERSLSSAFADVDGAIASYDAGEFVFAPTGGGDYRPASFYGEAAVSRAYLARVGLGDLQLEDFIDDPAVCPQAVVILKKREIVGMTAVPGSVTSTP